MEKPDVTPLDHAAAIARLPAGDPLDGAFLFTDLRGGRVLLKVRVTRAAALFAIARAGVYETPDTDLRERGLRLMVPDYTEILDDRALYLEAAPAGDNAYSM